MDKSSVVSSPSHHLPISLCPYRLSSQWRGFTPVFALSTTLFIPDSDSGSDGNLVELDGTSVFSGGRHHDHGSQQQPRWKSGGARVIYAGGPCL